MELIIDYWTGNFEECKKSLIRSAGQYLRNYDLKVGITNDPGRRKKQYEFSGEKWKYMIVKYHTSSLNYINQMEKIVIDKHWEVNQNKIAGGGGPNGVGPYYLYFVLK